MPLIRTHILEIAIKQREGRVISPVRKGVVGREIIVLVFAILSWLELLNHDES